MPTFSRLLIRLLLDRSGASMVEFALAFPVLASVSLGTVDLSYVLYQWNAAAKATQRGVREAAVFDPVAVGLNNFIGSYWAEEPYNLHIGKPCSDASGIAIADNCPTFNVTCTSTACSDGYEHSAVAFNRIFTKMSAVYPLLGEGNVEIRYKSTGLGFAGRPGGLPVEVTVRIRCMRQQLFFLNGFVNLVTPPADAECANLPGSSEGWKISESRATLITEDLCDYLTTDPDGPTCDRPPAPGGK